jgi:hypothetical protein
LANKAEKKSELKSYLNFYFSRGSNFLLRHGTHPHIYINKNIYSCGWKRKYLCKQHITNNLEQEISSELKENIVIDKSPFKGRQMVFSKFRQLRRFPHNKNSPSKALFSQYNVPFLPTSLVYKYVINCGYNHIIMNLKANKASSVHYCCIIRYRGA